MDLRVYNESQLEHQRKYIAKFAAEIEKMKGMEIPKNVDPRIWQAEIDSMQYVMDEMIKGCKDFEQLQTRHTPKVWVEYGMTLAWDGYELHHIDESEGELKEFNTIHGQFHKLQGRWMVKLD